jgi:IMP dehydrogenase
MPTTIHRWFDTPEDQIKFFESCSWVTSESSCFLSVGMKSKWESWIRKLINYRFETGRYFSILVDVANGDTKGCVETVKWIKTLDPNVIIMAGNVATRSGFARLQDAGAKFIRVNIGSGSICSTRINCGFGVPTLTAIMDCAKVKEYSYLVADGGIEYPGDICKAMAAGADMVMIGKMLAATSLSGGEKIDIDGEKYVRYSGMASKDAIEKLKSQKSAISVEGASGLIKYTGETEDVVNGIFGNLKSAMAYYAGCRNWKEFQRKVKFLEITSQGWEESKTRLIS